MTPDEIAALEKLAASAGRDRANTVLNATVVILSQLVHTLVVKNVLTKEDFAKAIAATQEKAVESREETPELFSVLSQATMMLGALFGATPVGKPS